MLLSIFLAWLKAKREDGGRRPACRPGGGGAGVFIALWNRFHVFVGEPEPLVPYVRHSNR
jgi:hypothetical protein